MYNINSHYENIYNFLSTIISQPRVLYLHPFGATQPENIESLSANMSSTSKVEAPMFIFYDQEPIYGEFNFTLFDYIRDNIAGPHVLVTTEKESDGVKLIQEKYGWTVIYYFHHVFAAHDWFRGYEFDSNLIPPTERKIRKKYISFNRLTSSSRVYRSLLISELYKHGLLEHGYVSYNDICPENGHNFVRNLSDARDSGLISQEVWLETVGNIAKSPLPLRIDYKDKGSIPNHSFILSAVPETQESFVYVVTETCYWERKCHLTEKIFKPIVSRMPFILVGCAFNLEYLKSYGFKTFDKWWNEDYDFITDPLERMKAIGNLLKSICSRSNEELEQMLCEMQPVLDHNYNLFYSKEFIGGAWKELTDGLTKSIPPSLLGAA